MSDHPIQRVEPITVTEAQRLWMIEHGTGARTLYPQEILLTSDQLRFFRRSICIGPAVWHGAVASEAAMLALHTTSARGCWPVGDKCLRTDLGSVLECVSGNGATAADWVVVVDGGALAGHDASPTAHADIRAAIEAGTSLPNAAAVAKVGEAAGSPQWDGAAWPTGQLTDSGEGGESLIAATPLGLRRLIAGTGITIVATATALTLHASGGGSSGPAGFAETAFAGVAVGVIATDTTGTGWSGPGMEVEANLPQSLDAFVGIEAGLITTVTTGSGWAAPGVEDPSDTPQCADDFAGVAVGPITSITTGYGWAAPGVEL